MSISIHVFGAGGHAKVVIDAWQAGGGSVAGIWDDNPASAGARLIGVPVLGSREMIDATDPLPVAPAIGNNRARFDLIEWLLARGVPLQTVVHPHAVVARSASLGAGVFLAAGAIVNPDAMLGDGVIVNTGASVDHDCRIGPSVHIGPGARLCGNVTIGARTLIGVGAAIIPGIRIGDDAVIGAGTTIVRDVPSGATVCGAANRMLRDPA